MATIHSKVKALDGLDFSPFPTRPTSGLRIVRIYGTLFARNTKTGRLFTTSPGLTSNSAFPPGSWMWMGSLLEALVRLDVITAADRDAELAWCATQDRREAAKMALTHGAAHALSDLGVKLTKGQISKLNAIASGAGGEG